MVVVEEGEVACSNKDDKLKRETRDKQTCILCQNGVEEHFVWFIVPVIDNCRACLQIRMHKFLISKPKHMLWVLKRTVSMTVTVLLSTQNTCFM